MLMKVAVTTADDEVEAEGEQQQASDDVEDDGWDLFFASFFPAVFVGDGTGLGVETVQFALGHA